MFANGSAALKQVGGQLKKVGAKPAIPAVAGAKGIADLSNRKRKKVLNDVVDTHARLSAIDTAHHEARTQQTAAAVTDFAAQGHHNIQVVTPHGAITVQSTPRPFTGATGDTSHNPSPDVHGAPSTGAHAGTDGYYSGHSAHTDLAKSATVYEVPRSAISAGAAKPAAKAPQLALPAPAPKGLPAYAPLSKSAPFTATAGGDTFVPGQSARPDTTKKAGGPERTFVVGKQGPLHTRETTPGNESKPIAKVRPLNAPYGGPDDGKKKKRTGKKKTD